MKKVLLLLVFVFSSLISCTQEETTTYYLIRHAEKDRTDKTNKNPNLNEKGLERAKKWAEYFKDVDFDAVYSTNYNRTMQTALPTAESNKLNIKNYDPKKMYDVLFKSATQGKTVLVVGHSNTTPVFANKILGEKKYKNMDDKDNSSLYIVTMTGNKKTSRIKKVE
jgi:broad specificity phosphatase PhoE|tara:strand:+ start:653 stop:1150 length:498 start_codon:yes stop_codon:yes gene_type:complete